MKPTVNAHVIRMLLKSLGSELRTDHDGHSEGHVMPNPDDYTSPRAFAIDYQAYNLNRKLESETATVTQMRNALDKWVDAEWRCSVVNKTGWWVMPIEKSSRDRIRSLQQRTATHISRILCDVWPDPRFEPTSGATATTTRSLSFACTKVDGTPLDLKQPEPHKCNKSCEDYLAYMFEIDEAIASRFQRARMRAWSMPLEKADCKDLAAWSCENTPDAVLDYVPKDASSVRLIVKPNSLTSMVQKTFGEAVSRALLNEGIDLTNQMVNREWAEIGSLTGIVATVDETAASDSIALRLLEWFPDRWQTYFAASRDQYVSVKGKRHKLNMIAGMGNGFIFELESLLFYSMALSVTEYMGESADYVSVYGDDLIIPSRCLPILEEFFLAYGILVNSTKSYNTGSFRESCGGHYFNGVDVTPVYMKRKLNNVGDFYHLINGLYEWSNRIGFDLTGELQTLVDMIPKKDRHVVPRDWGLRAGLHFIADGVSTPRLVWDRKLQRYVTVYRVYREKPLDVTERVPDHVQLVNWFVSSEMDEVLVEPTPKMAKSSWFRQYGKEFFKNPPYGKSKAKLLWNGDERHFTKRI